MPLRTEDLIETENAERRCSVCHSGRGSRRFEVVCPTGREPVVLCGNCRARFGDDPPIGRQPAHLSEPVRAPADPPAPPEQRQPDQRRDRLRAALPELPGSFSTAMAARAAGMNSDKALAGSRTSSAAATFDALASAGRPSRHRASSPQPWTGSKRGRATFGSSENAHRSADQPPARHRRLIAADQLCSRPSGTLWKPSEAANLVIATRTTVMHACPRPAVMLAGYLLRSRA